MKNVVTYKNKIIGVCALATSVFIFPYLAKASVYERTPSGSGTYSQVDFYYELDSGEFNTFKAENDTISADWDSCHIELESLSSGSVSLVNLGNNYGDGAYTATALGELDMEVGDVAFVCYDSDDEENTTGKKEIEESTGYALFTLAETSETSGYYSDTFPSDSATQLSGNLVSFVSDSNIMKVVLLILSFPLGFFLIWAMQEYVGKPMGLINEKKVRKNKK